MIEQWPSPAKLNLFLYIIGQRSDGYHLLQTLFQFLDYSDTITILARKDKKIRLVTPIPGVANEKNLIMRAAQLLCHYCQQQHLPFYGVDISIEKILPMGGGLGGGSSNAATVLVALNQLWQCQLSIDTLMNLGLSLGADVPIFIYGQAAFAQGVGEKLTAVTLPEKWYLVAHPGIHIPTALIFSDCELTRNTPMRSLETLLATPFTNDCEVIARKRFPEVEELISWLLQYAPSRLTGTGACVFAEFNSEAAARKVLEQAPIWLHAFIAKGVNTSPLYRHIEQ